MSLMGQSLTRCNFIFISPLSPFKQCRGDDVTAHDFAIDIFKHLYQIFINSIAWRWRGGGTLKGKGGTIIEFFSMIA